MEFGLIVVFAVVGTALSVVLGMFIGFFAYRNVLEHTLKHSGPRILTNFAPPQPDSNAPKDAVAEETLLAMGVSGRRGLTPQDKVEAEAAFGELLRQAEAMVPPDMEVYEEPEEVKQAKAAGEVS